jgi:histidinol-phosphate aminotransferase
MIKIPEHIQKLIPYKAGKPIEELAREKGIKKIVKLASNENPLGPSPKAVEAIKKALTEIHRYTDPSAFKLVNAISNKYKIPSNKIVPGSGSDSILQYIITAFSDVDDEIITSEGSFIGWYVNANKYGRKSLLTPLKNYAFDLDAISELISSKNKLIYLANPNNPTGTMFTKSEFEKFMKIVPDSVLVVLDEAYTVYAEDNPEYPNGFEYNYKNLIVIRTLSKAYGLAGIRIGFAVAEAELIRELYKVKLPFEPNMLAQEAAIAALDDEDFLIQTKQANKVSLDRMKNKFDEIGIEYVSTSANFYLMLLNNQATSIRFNEECLNLGLILRPVNTFGIPNGIRINSGTEEETTFALEVIESVSNKILKANTVNN